MYFLRYIFLFVSITFGLSLVAFFTSMPFVLAHYSVSCSVWCCLFWSVALALRRIYVFFFYYFIFLVSIFRHYYMLKISVWYYTYITHTLHYFSLSHTFELNVLYVDYIKLRCVEMLSSKNLIIMETRMNFIRLVRKQ